MGDVAMAAPVVREVRRRYPDVGITILTNPFFQPFFRDIKGVTFARFDKNGKHKGFVGLLRLYRDIRREYGIDMVADLHDVVRTQVLRTLFLLAGKKVAFIHKGRKGKRRLTAPEGRKVFTQLKTTAQRYADVFARLGYPVETVAGPRRVKAPVPEIAGEKVGIWIGIAPFAQHKGKIYPLEKMEAVVASLSRMPGVSLFIFGGGEGERMVAEEWQARYGNVMSVVGKIKLEEELDLIANLDCMVSMDSAAMHMASLMGTPVVSVWGATHPYAGFMGIGQSADNTVQTELACRPCSVYGNVECKKGYRCMDLITPEMIIEKISNVTQKN